MKESSVERVSSVARAASESHVPSQELADVANSLEGAPERAIQSQATLPEDKPEDIPGSAVRQKTGNQTEESPHQSKESIAKKTKTVTTSGRQSAASSETPKNSRLSRRSISGKDEPTAFARMRHSKEQRSSVPDSRYTTYKVHQLDWWDVESRIKKICADITYPLSEGLQGFKQRLTKHELAFQMTQEDTSKLNSAVFHKDKTHRNIFHVM